jgi:transcriptional regulator with XRE-family HTH domain
MEHVNEYERRAAVRIANLRRYREMTQQQLATASGLSRIAIASIENCTRYIKLGEAVTLSAALGVELGDLVSAEPLVLHLPIE